MTEAEIRWRLWVNEPANAAFYTQSTGRAAPAPLPKAEYDRLWYQLPENKAWYHAQPGTPPPAPTGTSGTPNDPTARDAEGRESARAILADVLEQYGLGSLSDWAWGQITNDRSVEEVLLDLRDQPTFKERFKAIDVRRANGLPAVSPQTIIDYENTARDLLRSSGLPAGFYDSPDDFAQLIGKGVSLQSVQQRVVESWERVVNSPVEVRQAFADIYGVAGDQALAAFMFDPDQSESTLKRMAQTAVAGGAMRSFGFDLDAAGAARVAGFDLEDNAVRGGFGRLAQLKAVFNETLGERQDLTVGREGVNAVFDGGEGATAIEDRITQRRNAFGGGGGALLSQEGLAGSAR